MTGWHYTTADAWSKIRHEGLKPFPLKTEQRWVFFGIKAGIWLYLEQQRGERFLGLMCERIVQYRTMRLVELKVEYERWIAASWLLRIENSQNREYRLTHDGWWDRDRKSNDKWHDEEPFELAVYPIAPAQIQLARDLTPKEWL